jgi:hypothetical protein
MNRLSSWLIVAASTQILTGWGCRSEPIEVAGVATGVAGKVIQKATEDSEDWSWMTWIGNGSAALFTLSIILIPVINAFIPLPIGFSRVFRACLLGWCISIVVAWLGAHPVIISLSAVLAGLGALLWMVVEYKDELKHFKQRAHDAAEGLFNEDFDNDGDIDGVPVDANKQ